MKDQSWRERVVLVTGAGAGIGAAVAHRLGAAGAVVIGVDQDREALTQTASRLDAVAGSFVPAAGNVTDLDRLSRIAADAAQEYGGLDGLVCAAGIQRYGTVDAADPAVYTQVMEVNVTGAVNACRVAIPPMRTRGGGAIVLLSSAQAYASQRQVAAYTASKAALLGLMKAMAIDHAPDKIRVNAVCPGSIDTPMLRWAADLFSEGGDPDEVVHQWGRAHPLGRVGTVTEVADAIEFLLSDRASFITGADLKVDGGLTAGLAAALPEVER